MYFKRIFIYEKVVDVNLLETETTQDKEATFLGRILQENKQLTQHTHTIVHIYIYIYIYIYI